MAFFRLVLKAHKLRKAREKYLDEKLKSIEISEGKKVHYTFAQKIRRKKIQFKLKIKDICKKFLFVPENSWVFKKIIMIKTDGTIENYILRSFMGFVGGIILTYMFFVFFVFQLHFALSSATILCSVFGIILTIGLAFSTRVRCMVFLLLPQFFSKRGRHALMAYAFILTLTGPVKNTLHNVGVLSESLACGQDQLKEAIKTIIDLIKQPFFTLKESVTKIIKSVKFIVKKMKQSLLAIKRLVLSILHVIKAVFLWLESIVNICNKTLGTPFDRCQRVFDGAVADCKAKLGPFFGTVCNLTYIVHSLCYIVKPFDFICMLVSYVADTVVSVVQNKIKKFTTHIRAMFYVKVKFSHAFTFETNQSRTVEEISSDIVTEIRERTEGFLTIFDWMSFVTSFFFFFMLLKVLHYRYKWLTVDRFDNHYLTKDLREIDLKRTKQDKETILPLNRRECNKYASLNSITLIKAERRKLAKSAVFLCLTTFKLLFHIAADYSLYWVLNMIRYHGRVQMKIQQPNSVGVYVSGDGFLAELYRSIIKAFSPMGEETNMDTLPCLPDPIPPDFDKYTQILTLITFCWIMTFVEPYGLRLRVIVMNYYHPDRAQQRAVWLYNHILRSRGTFLKFARRQLRRKFGLSNDEIVEKVTFKERLYAMIPLLDIFWPRTENACILCGTIEKDPNTPHIKCSTPNCVGLYCTVCFSDLQNICTICRAPTEYGDLSDISEERDSSEESFTLPQSKQIGDINFFTEEEHESDFDQDVKEYDDTEEGMEKDEETVHLLNSIKNGIKVQKVKKDNYHSSSSTSYSYGYQRELLTDTDFMETQIPYRDVEAQKLRDDVSMQVFDVLTGSSSTDDSVTCFVLKARRKLKSKFKQVKIPCTASKLRTSIIGKEAFFTEDVDTALTETENDSESQLLIQKEDKVEIKKTNGFRNYVNSFFKFFKPKNNQYSRSMKGHPLLQIHRPIDDETSSTEESSGYNKYPESYDSHRKSREQIEDYFEDNTFQPYEKYIALNTSPRFLESAAEETKYYEIDERNMKYLNALSLGKTSTISISTKNMWNIIVDEQELHSSSANSDSAESTGRNLLVLSATAVDKDKDKPLKNVCEEPKFRDTNEYIESISDISSGTLDRNSSRG